MDEIRNHQLSFFKQLWVVICGSVVEETHQCQVHASARCRLGGSAAAVLAVSYKQVQDSWF
jgi:hypothetical protein